jgi:hypothetical protein
LRAELKNARPIPSETSSSDRLFAVGLREEPLVDRRELGRRRQALRVVPQVRE